MNICYIWLWAMITLMLYHWWVNLIKRRRYISLEQDYHIVISQCVYDSPGRQIIVSHLRYLSNTLWFACEFYTWRGVYLTQCTRLYSLWDSCIVTLCLWKDRRYLSASGKQFVVVCFYMFNSVYQLCDK